MKSVGDSCASNSSLSFKETQLEATDLRGFLVIFLQVQGSASTA